MARWRDFERLAEKIVAELSPSAAVTFDDRIRGSLSEAYRQIDVSVRWRDAGKDHLLIVQAKDWTTPADIKAVDAFAAVIQDVSADRGILVCRAGFSRQAQKYARNRDISLWNLHDAESANWNLQLTVPLLWIDLFPHG
jgi:hypothetical protein